MRKAVRKGRLFYVCGSSACRKRLNSLVAFFLVSSCSQIRRTFQPLRRKVKLTSLSLVLLAVSLRDQNSRLFVGIFECFGQPCQKQPSTNTATFNFGNTKSGLPNSLKLRLQPVKPSDLNRAINFNSVSLFPLPRIRDITELRFSIVKTSGIDSNQAATRPCSLFTKSSTLRSFTPVVTS